jgi:hypothetical protein
MKIIFFYLCFAAPLTAAAALGYGNSFSCLLPSPDSCTANRLSLLGQPAENIESKLCVQLLASWNIEPGNPLQFTVQDYFAPNERVFALEFWDTKKPFNPIVLDVITAEPAPDRSYEYGMPAEVFCWEKGKEIISDEESRIALVYAHIDHKRNVTPLKVWALDKERGQLILVGNDSVVCSAAEFRRNTEALLTAEEKLIYNKRLLERGLDSPWNDPEPLRP